MLAENASISAGAAPATRAQPAAAPVQDAPVAAAPAVGWASPPPNADASPASTRAAAA